jgi:hypothetical protein
MDPDTLAERELAEIERFEEAIESALVASAKRGVTAAELRLVLADYVDDLEELECVPSGWDGGNSTGPTAHDRRR